jgi:hypothetical protein
MNNKLETRTAIIGFILAAVIIAVTAISYGMYSPFPIRPLVWLIVIAFSGVALLALEWPRAYLNPPGETPKGNHKLFLLVAIPLAFVLDSQICGLGLAACSVVCNLISFALIILAIVMAIRINQGQPVGGLLIPVVFLGVIPHCICQSPINVIWQSIFNGLAPTCQIIPLATTLFALTALRGRRPLLGTILVVVLLIVTIFISIGNPLFGFPWRGCVG